MTDSMNQSLSQGQFGGTSGGGALSDPAATAGLSGPLGSSGEPGAVGNSSSGLTGSFGMGAGGMGSGGLGM
jgi:hypothetical protein